MIRESEVYVIRDVEIFGADGEYLLAAKSKMKKSRDLVPIE